MRIKWVVSKLTLLRVKKKQFMVERHDLPRPEGTRYNIGKRKVSVIPV